MTDFDYDCLQRKRLAQQARYRKCGAKSRKCPMSTDNMTERQWRERNGELVTLNLNQPISWAEFKSLSPSLQEEYIRHLISTYNANATKLSEMFGVGSSAIKAQFQRSGLDIQFHVGHSMTKAQRQAWEAFLHNAGGMREPIDSQDELQQGDADVSVQTAEMSMTSFSLSFDGKIDINMIANSLLHILGRDAVGEVQIVCNLAERVS